MVLRDKHEHAVPMQERSKREEVRLGDLDIFQYQQCLNTCEELQALQNLHLFEREQLVLSNVEAQSTQLIVLLSFSHRQMQALKLRQLQHHYQLLTVCRNFIKIKLTFASHFDICFSNQTNNKYLYNRQYEMEYAIIF